MDRSFSKNNMDYHLCHIIVVKNYSNHNREASLYPDYFLASRYTYTDTSEAVTHCNLLQERCPVSWINGYLGFILFGLTSMGKESFRYDPTLVRTVNILWCDQTFKVKVKILVNSSLFAQATH